MKLLIALVLTTLGLTIAILAYRVTAGSGDASSESPVEQKVNPSPDADAKYWTPERLREAKPIVMPHPASPPSGWDSFTTRQPDEEGSASGTGGSGDGDVAPDESNVLFPREGVSNDKPTWKQ